MDLHFIILTALIGLVSGAFGGLLGIGGSIIMIPLLTLVHGPNQQLYQAAAMIVNVPVSASATIKHGIKGVIQPGLVKRLLPTALIGIVLGVALSNAIPTHGLQIVFSIFLAYVGLNEMVGIIRSRVGRASGEEKKGSGESEETKLPKHGRIPLIGGINGMIAGLLGIGGGVILIPLLRQFCHLQVRAAIAASSATMLVTATVGAVYKNLTLSELLAPDGTHLQVSESLSIAAAMVPTAFIGSYLGAGMTHRLPIPTIKMVFGALVLVAAARMAWMTTHSPEPAPPTPPTMQTSP